MYLAAYENKLASDVRAGENRGKRLEHDYVVREWIGPIAFGEGLRLEEKRALPLLPNVNSKHFGRGRLRAEPRRAKSCRR